MLGVEAQTQIFLGNLGIYKGAVYENLVADIFNKLDKPLYYYERNASIELDFIIADGLEVVAVEVKSSSNTKSNSLDSALQQALVQKGIRFSMRNLSQNKNILDIPLYCSNFI